MLECANRHRSQSARLHHEPRAKETKGQAAQRMREFGSKRVAVLEQSVSPVDKQRKADKRGHRKVSDAVEKRNVVWLQRELFAVIVDRRFAICLEFRFLLSLLRRRRRWFGVAVVVGVVCKFDSVIAIRRFVVGFYANSISNSQLDRSHMQKRRKRTAHSWSPSVHRHLIHHHRIDDVDAAHRDQFALVAATCS